MYTLGLTEAFVCCIIGFMLGLSTMIMGTPIKQIQGWSAKIVWVIVSILYIVVFFWTMNNYL